MGQPSRPLVRLIASSLRGGRRTPAAPEPCEGGMGIETFASMHDIFRIRRATVEDVDIIAWHRANVSRHGRRVR